MCRDYILEKQWRLHKKLLDEEFEKRKRPVLRVVSPSEGYEPNDYVRMTMALTKPSPIVRAVEDGDGCELTNANWWFVPSTFKGTYREFQRKLTTFNARSDGIAKSNTFRKAFATRRCLVSATGWYEWTEPPDWKKGKPKTKWRFALGDAEPIFFAGIWDRFENTDPENPGPMDTFALVTHDAGPGVDTHHDRAPIVLGADAWADWLDRSTDNPLGLLPPASAANAYGVHYVSGPEPAKI